MVFISWIVLSLLVGMLGSNRKIGFGWAFFASLILSPIIGLIITLISKTETEAALEKIVYDTHSKNSIESNSLTYDKRNFTKDLENLKSLKDNGILNEEEYQKAKNKLLS